MATVLTDGEEEVMRAAFKATMLRAADIVDHITDDDVAEAQMVLFASGVRLGDLRKIDRALVASCHLRACAEGVPNQPARQIAELKKAVGA
jgi:hypothetical protein